MSDARIDPYDIVVTLARLTDPQQAFGELLRMCTKWLDADCGQIIAREIASGDCEVLAATACEPESASFSTTILNGALRTDQAVCIPNAKEHPLYRSARSVSDVETAVLSVIVVPLRNEDGIPAGAMYLQRRSPDRGPFTPDPDMGELTRIMDLLSPILFRQRQQLFFNGVRLSHTKTILGRMGMIVGNNAAMDSIYARIDRFSQTDLNVCIEGPTGAGKELVVQAIHRMGPRSGGPLIKVPCNAVPSELAESEFFGHVKGSYSGAHEDKPGRFELAHGGTLFLDEVSRLSPATQATLLHALERHDDGSIKFFRVGGTKEISTDVRVVAASNQRLRELVEKGEFREDLYFRLQQLSLRLPSLQDRREDLPFFIEAFLMESNRQHGKSASLSERAFAALLTHPWPGNVRELRNCMHSAVLLHDSPGPLEPRDLFPEEWDRVRQDQEKRESAVPFRDMSKREKLEAVRLAMERYGSTQKAAEVLGVSRQTIYNYLEAWEDEGPRSE